MKKKILNYPPKTSTKNRMKKLLKFDKSENDQK